MIYLPLIWPVVGVRVLVALLMMLLATTVELVLFPLAMLLLTVLWLFEVVFTPLFWSNVVVLLFASSIGPLL